MAKQPERTEVAMRYQGREIRSDRDGMVSLTDMWRAQGSPENRDPAQWRRSRDAASFIKDLAKSENMGIPHVFRSARGRNSSGTWAHWQVALAYAKYLSNEFHRHVNQAYREWTEEKANPDLKTNRAYQGYIERGMSPEWAQRRMKGIIRRRVFVDALNRHGVSDGDDIGICTGVMNKAVIGQTATEFRKSRGLPERANTRDHLDARTLFGLEIAEGLATLSIDESNAAGLSQCKPICANAGKIAREAIDKRLS